MYIWSKVLEFKSSSMYSDAMASQDNIFWKEAMDDEMQSIMGTNT